jgi:hypothetical protein
LLERCNTLWIGERLGLVERACLRSIMRAGHPLRLYSYREITGIPDGVEHCDAAEILPEACVIRHSSGSVSLFSNWFRYELLRRGGGIWVDADVYALKALDFTTPFLFGLEEQGRINGAVLKIPHDSRLLTQLLEVFNQKSVPFWLSGEDRIAAQTCLDRTGRIGLDKLRWGSTGPDALTACTKVLSLEHWAQGKEVFYPAHWSEALWIIDPCKSVEEYIFPETRCIHLWNEKIKGCKDRPAPSGTFLARLQAEGT